MKTFEIHITGVNKNILMEFENKGIKTLHAQLLSPTEEIVGEEFMSSLIKKFETYEDCKLWVDELCSKIHTDIRRVKIECPVYEEYIERSLYIETHFPTTNNLSPFVKNVRSSKLVSTEREYDKTKYKEFIEKYKDNKEVELCLYDDYIREDFYWFNLFKL